MNDELRTLVLENVNIASKGREIWLNLVDELKIQDNDYVILMPSINKQYNYYAMLHLNQFLEQKNANKAIILTFDENVIESATLFSNKISKIINFSRAKAEMLMKFYSLYMFTDKLIIISLDEPEGRNGKQLIGKKGITLEEIIAIGIYGLRRFEKVEEPIYTGANEIIISFLESFKGGN